ncbi:MAG: PAS domain S-box protein [Planctomycetota bacterium]|nr:MAG: PAS domain S-box protein [Planctomycetota bacterium]
MGLRSLELSNLPKTKRLEFLAGRGTLEAYCGILSLSPSLARIQARGALDAVCMVIHPPHSLNWYGGLASGEAIPPSDWEHSMARPPPPYGDDGMDLDFHRDPRVLADIVDVMPVGVFTVDRAGRFIAWNAGAERITGYRSPDVLGQPCRLLEGKNCKGFARLVDLLQDPSDLQGGICNQECKIESRDGRVVHIHGSIRVLFDPDGQVVGAVGAFMDVTALVQANEKIARLETRHGEVMRFGDLTGRSPAMRETFRRLQLAADSQVTVLLTGPSGTGKELAARAIHQHSDRAERPFLAINCSAIPDALLESELFGHVKGAFTGAAADKQGLFEAADGGTLFLDEIGDVSPAVQVKLLRVLQEREIRRIGASRSKRIDVRLITATNRDLAELVKQEKMREDFYYRIHVFEIRMPPLRERREDIRLLAEQILHEVCTAGGRAVNGFSREALHVLEQYDWPGNVRQLRNAIEHACVSATGDRITVWDLPAEIRQLDRPAERPASPGWTPEEQSERRRILTALEKTAWNRTRAAEELGVSRVTLWKKMNRYAIRAP